MKYISPEMKIEEFVAIDIITLSGDDPADDIGDNGNSNVPGGSAGGTEW